MYDLKDILRHTSFSYSFFRKCLLQLGNILEPYIQRGEHNKLLFDSNSLVILDKIKQLKDQNLSLAEIRKRLEKDLPNLGQTRSTNVEQTLLQTSDNQPLLEKVFQLYQEVNDEKEKRIREQEEKERIIQAKEQVVRELESKNRELQGALKLLPDGKTPEQIRADYQNRQERKIQIAHVLGELKNTGILNFRKRRLLLAELEKLTLPPV